MILGLSTSTFTSVHVALSLIGIVSGVIVLYGMVRATRLDGWTTLFLATTVLTSVTAFFFPSTSFGPAHVVGVLSLVVLAAAIAALYFFRLAGPWRWIYIVGAVLAAWRCGGRDCGTGCGCGTGWGGTRLRANAARMESRVGSLGAI